MPVLETLLEDIQRLDFTNMARLAEALPPLLEELARPEVLTKLVQRFLDNPHLRGMSEQLAELDKLVLHVDPETDARVRMHIFRQGYWDRPHNHRFNFGTRLLTGSYVHTVYGHATDNERLDSCLVTARLKRVERAGESYVIEHTLVHSVAARSRTVTLTVRSPSTKDSMLIVGDEGPFLAFGARHETQAELDAKRLTVARIDELITMLRELRLVQ